MDDPTLGQQQLGQALVETLKSDLLDQCHQLDDTFAKKVENEVAEGTILVDQSVEHGGREQQ
jgi:hypothetical protein